MIELGLSGSRLCALCKSGRLVAQMSPRPEGGKGWRINPDSARKYAEERYTKQE